jgi:hypothetical protein
MSIGLLNIRRVAWWWKQWLADVKMRMPATYVTNRVELAAN